MLGLSPDKPSQGNTSCSLLTTNVQHLKRCQENNGNNPTRVTHLIYFGLCMEHPHFTTKIKPKLPMKRSRNCYHHHEPLCEDASLSGFSPAATGGSNLSIRGHADRRHSSETITTSLRQICNMCRDKLSSCRDFTLGFNDSNGLFSFF